MDKYSQLSIDSILNDEICVDKPVYKSNEVKNKVEILKVDMKESLIEGTLIDIPFIYYYQQANPITAIEYIWNTPKGKWTIEVRGSKHGVPDAYSFNILLAIFKIWLNNNGSILKMCDKKVFDMNRVVHFTYKELAQLMGYKSYGGSIQARIEKGLETLIDTTIYSKQLSKIFTVKDEECIKKNVKTMQICGNLRSFSCSKVTKGNKIDEDIIREETSIMLGDFFYYSFCNAHFKIYNYDVYLKLSNDISKKIFLILNKWRNNRSKMVLSFQVLCERIPLKNDKSKYYRRRRIKQAIEQLIEVGYLSKCNIKNDNYEFIFKSKKKKATEKEKAIIEKYNNFLEIKEGFIKNGITEEEMEHIFDISRMPYIKALLRYCDVNRDKIKDVRGYVLAGLTIKEYNIDDIYFN